MERVEWSGRPDARVGWLRSVIDGRVSVPLAHGDLARGSQSAACRGRASGRRRLGDSVRSASCAPALPVQCDIVPRVQRAAGLRVVLRARTDTHGGPWPQAGLVRCAPALGSCLRRDGRRCGLLMSPAASPDGITECCDELNTYAQVRLVRRGMMIDRGADRGGTDLAGVWLESPDPPEMAPCACSRGPVLNTSQAAPMRSGAFQFLL